MLGNAVVVRINSKRAVLARRTPFAVESERAFEVAQAALRTLANRLPRINTEFHTAAYKFMPGPRGH